MTTLWYLWKARNDLRFQRRKGSVFQVHHALEADINVSTIHPPTSSPQSLDNHSHSEGWQQTFSFAGPHIGGEERAMLPHPDQAISGPSTNNFNCSLPILMPGPRCYSDASIAPDSISSRARSAGLGILLLDPTHNLKCYIKAKIDHISSVLMAESASMALAAKICALLSISDISFLTDSQILASFFNGPALDKPPQWEIKPYTQKFLNATGNYNWKVFKVQRDFNVTAHVLANQAFRSTLGTEIIE
jgi:hypothetical protein